jgi:hypothetical protein
MSSSSGKAIMVTVPFENISDVTLAGSGSIIESTIKVDRFNTKLSGSGDIVLTIDATDAIVSLSGSGDITCGKPTIMSVNYRAQVT